MNSRVAFTHLNMPFLLANLPPEALVPIFSYLENAETFARLYGCGNRHLMKVITSGGVTHIHLLREEPLIRTLSFVPSLRLDSITVDPGVVDDNLLRALVRALPSTLRSLKLTYEYPTSFWLSDYSAGDRAPAPLGGALAHVDTTSLLVWAVKDTFPRLEILETRGGFSTDIVTFVRILCGLPRTLRELDLDFLNDCNFDFYPLLPPGLERLGSGDLPLPFGPSVRLNCLTSLELVVPQYNVQSYGTPYGYHGTSWAPKDITQMQLSPALTSLSLSLVKITPWLSTLVSRLPSGLRNLGLEMNSKSEHSAKEFVDVLRHIPSSVTSLQLYNFVVSPDDPLEAVSTHTKTFSSLKRFEFVGFVVPPLLRALLETMSMSPLESFSLATPKRLIPEGMKTGPALTLEMIKFIGARLHTLQASLAEECFPNGEGPYPLHELLPKLHTLKLESPTVTCHIRVDIPPTVTRLLSDTAHRTGRISYPPDSIRDDERHSVPQEATPERWIPVHRRGKQLTAEELIADQARSQPFVYAPFLGIFLRRDIQWPDELTSVHCSRTDQHQTGHRQPALASADIFYFPPTITKLKIPGCNGNQNLVGSLPATLTYLEAPQWIITHRAPSWPPRLTFLETSFYGEMEPKLASLPPLLTHLVLNQHISSNIFPAIPPQVKRLTVGLSDFDFDHLEMLEFAKRRKDFVWIIRWADVKSALKALSTHLDFDSAYDEMAKSLRESWDREDLGIVEDEELGKEAMDASQTDASHAPAEPQEHATQSDEEEIQAPARRIKRPRQL